MRLRHILSSVVPLVAVTLGVFSTNSVKAQDIQFVSVTAFANMEDRLEDIEYRLAGFEGLGDKGSVGACDCGAKGGKGANCASCGTCTSAGWTLDAELLFLRPFGTDNGYFDTNNQYNAGVRLAGGYTRDDGLGARIRWFSYGVDPEALEGHFDAYYLDFELTDKFQLGCWEGTLAGGIRFAEFDQLWYEDGMYGWGPEVGVSLARPLFGNVYLIGSGRYSMLFGEEQWDQEDDTWTVSELQLGAEYRRSTCGTIQWFARVALEAQYWGAVADDDEEDLGLVGAAFALGFTR